MEFDEQQISVHAFPLEHGFPSSAESQIESSPSVSLPPPLWARGTCAAAAVLLLQLVRQTMESDSSDLPLCRTGRRPTRPCEVATGPPAGAPTLNTVYAPTARLICGQRKLFGVICTHFGQPLRKYWSCLSTTHAVLTIKLHEEPCKFMWLWYSRTGCPVSSLNYYFGRIHKVFESSVSCEHTVLCPHQSYALLHTMYNTFAFLTRRLSQWLYLTFDLFKKERTCSYMILIDVVYVTVSAGYHFWCVGFSLLKLLFFINSTFAISYQSL